MANDSTYAQIHNAAVFSAGQRGAAIKPNKKLQSGQQSERVLQHGHEIGNFALDDHSASQVCDKLTKATGHQHDWHPHQQRGRVVIKALYDKSVKEEVDHRLSFLEWTESPDVEGVDEAVDKSPEARAKRLKDRNSKTDREIEHREWVRQQKNNPHQWSDDLRNPPIKNFEFEKQTNEAKSDFKHGDKVYYHILRKTSDERKAETIKRNGVFKGWRDGKGMVLHKNGETVPVHPHHLNLVE